MSEDVRARVQLLDERLARLRQEKGRLLARASQADRKQDTRRKLPFVFFCFRILPVQ